jgi:hypothetical protein
LRYTFKDMIPLKTSLQKLITIKLPVHKWFIYNDFNHCILKIPIHALLNNGELLNRKMQLLCRDSKMSKALNN